MLWKQKIIAQLIWQILQFLLNLCECDWHFCIECFCNYINKELCTVEQLDNQHYCCLITLLNLISTVNKCTRENYQLKEMNVHIAINKFAQITKIKSWRYNICGNNALNQVNILQNKHLPKQVLCKWDKESNHCSKW